MNFWRQYFALIYKGERKKKVKLDKGEKNDCLDVVRSEIGIMQRSKE